MKKTLRSITALAMMMCYAVVISSHAQTINIDNLPIYNKQTLRAKTDWLIAGDAQKSAIYKTRKVIWF